MAKFWFFSGHTGTVLAVVFWPLPVLIQGLHATLDHISENVTGSKLHRFFPLKFSLICIPKLSSDMTIKFGSWRWLCLQPLLTLALPAESSIKQQWSLGCYSNYFSAQTVPAEDDLALNSFNKGNKAYALYFVSPRMSEWSFPEVAQRKANFTKVSLLSLGRRLWNKTKQSYKHRSALSRGAPLIKYFPSSYSSHLESTQCLPKLQVSKLKISVTSRKVTFQSPRSFPSGAPF